jgi:FdrA protein
LRDYVPQVYSNAPLDKRSALEHISTSREHTILDLGGDEFTVGRLHPMLDNDLRLRRLRQEAADPQTAVLLLDMVLGYGAHPDPASEMAPVIAEARAAAQEAGRHLEVVVAVVGTDEDPQDLERQVALLKEAGAIVMLNHSEAVAYAGRLVQQLARHRSDENSLTRPLAAINVGVEAFAESLVAQGAPVIHVDWRPPASGNERMMGILARMKAKAQ